MTAHSRYGASSAKRILACPGSLTLPQEYQRSSKYAAEGTAAHSLAQRCQLIGTQPEAYHGDLINVIDDETGESDGVFEVTDEMIACVQMFLDTAESFRKPDSKIRAEQRVLHKKNKEFGGTLDCEIDTPSESALTILDLKYGAGVGVEVEGNEQLLSYLTLRLSHVETWPEKVTVGIIQPRYDHPDGPVRLWSPSHDQIRDFEARFLRVIDPSVDTGDEFVVGDHCRWCPCKIHCPAVRAAASKLAKEEFNAVSCELSPTEINEILATKTAVLAYFEALENYRHTQMSNDVEFPGFKLVYKFSHRKWRLSPDEMLVKLRSRGFGKAVTFTESIKSPNQMEAVEGMDKKWLARFTDVERTGTKVVSVTHKSPAVNREADAAKEFEGLHPDG